MCYYDNYRFACGDWKWGNFRQHCQQEYRTGETCGGKLVYQTLPLADKCTLCDKIERKHRRLEKAKSDYSRWQNDPQRQASKGKAWEDIVALTEEMNKLISEKAARNMNIGNRR